MFTVDFHTHSRFFHGWRGRATRFDPLGLRANAVAARARGLDGFATTNHDYTYSATTFGAVSIPGVEVTTTLGHVLVIGPDPPARVTPRALAPTEAVNLAHERDCAAVLAHPYRNSAARDSGADFDAVEINGKNPEHIESTARLAKQLGCPLVGGSDAHLPSGIGRAYTRVDADDLTPRAVADAVREGRVTAVLHHNLFDRAVDRIYSAIHSAKGNRDAPD